MKHKITSLLALALGSLLALPTASAQLTRELRVHTSAHPCSNEFGCGPATTQSVGPDGPRSLSAPAVGGRCSAWSNWGVLKTYGNIVHPGNTHPLDTYWSNGRASFRDVVTINHPTLNGTQGMLTITYRVDANLTSSGQNPPEPHEWRSFARVNTRATIGIYVEDANWRTRPDGTVEYGDTGNIFNAPRMFTARFTFGEPFYLGLEILSNTQVMGNYQANNVSDAENTTTWGGFNGVTDLNGNPISGYTVTSDSGTNYTQPIPSALTATGAVSRKNHGSAGDFDVPLPGVEPRTGGANRDYTLIATFNNEVASGSASIASGVAMIADSPVISGNTMRVNLTGVNNAQTVTVNLNNVTDSFGQTLPQTAISAGFLIGDTNGNGSVTASDIGATKAQAGQPVTSSNFRADITPNGSINASDIGQVKATSGSVLP